jgi:pimeloyl-ACP methyl ester carboxylesterase
MPELLSNGVRIVYKVLGEGEPLLLIHGYTASGQTNFGGSGWLETLSKRYRLIVPDLRGHGKSGKPHNSSAYSLDLMARDVLACLGAEGLTGPVRIFGYSMGGMVALELLLNHPQRVSSAVIGGMGSSFPRSFGTASTCQEDDGEAVPTGARRGAAGTLHFLATYLRHYDPLAVNAVYRGVFRGRQPVDASRLGEIHAPVLCVVGTRDRLCQAVEALADRIPGAKLVKLSGRGHLSAIGDPRFKQAVLDFFANVPAPVHG